MACPRCLTEVETIEHMFFHENNMNQGDVRKIGALEEKESWDIHTSFSLRQFQPFLN